MSLSPSTIKNYLIPVLLILGVNIFYFLPQFQGKVVRQGDIIQHVGMSKEAVDFRNKTGDEALWTNSMFGGMPTYQISSRNSNNLLQWVERAMGLFIPRPAGYFIAGMIGFYVLLLLLGVDSWLSLLGAFLFGFTTNNFTLFEAGHNSKLMAIMTSAPVVAGVLLTFRGKYLIGGIVFGIALGMNIGTNHPQMTYYLAMCLGILVVIEFVKNIRNQTLTHFGRSLAIMALFGVLALGSSASKLWTTYEYSKETMRGGQVLSESSASQDAAKKGNGGLEWDYAMQWSNGAGDVLATFIPKVVGGGSGEWLDGKSDLGKAVGQRAAFQAPTYFGSLPFTSGPAYFGAVALFLFIFGMFSLKGEIKWWLFASVVLTTLLSMGKHFEFLNALFFDYLPMYNKFRSPSSILSVTAIFIPILGILALSDVLKSEDKTKFIRPLQFATGILATLAAVIWLTPGSFFSFSAPGDAQYEQIKELLIDQRESMVASSALRSLIFVLLTAGALYMYIAKRLTGNLLIAAIAILGLVDLIQVGKGYLDKRDFVSKNTYDNEFDPRPVDTQILQDNDPNFRVFDATINTFNSASTSYFHKTIGGYHAAKLQRYQDIIDRHISNNNQAVLNMLNTKYFIFAGQDGNPVAQRNPAALGNVWFINNIKWVENAKAEIDSLSSFDPVGDVVIHSEFKNQIGALQPSKNGTISLTSYAPNKLEYAYETEGEQIAVFSEIWYGPGKGWQAYIDGKPAEHIRVNYLLRGLKVPSGKHTVTFEFRPTSYYTGEWISLLCSLILLGLLAWVVFKNSKTENQGALA